MPRDEPEMIEAHGLTKRFGRTVAVDDLSFEVLPGVVTGFLGPTGSGKSTTMRLLLGLDRPDAGTATFGGRSYKSLPNPLREVGGLLDASSECASGSVWRRRFWAGQSSCRATCSARCRSWYLPFQAGSQLSSVEPIEPGLGALWASVLFFAFAIVLAITGTILVTRRDA